MIHGCDRALPYASPSRRPFLLTALPLDDSVDGALRLPGVLASSWPLNSSVHLGGQLRAVQDDCFDGTLRFRQPRAREGPGPAAKPQGGGGRGGAKGGVDPASRTTTRPQCCSVYYVELNPSLSDLTASVTWYSGVMRHVAVRADQTRSYWLSSVSTFASRTYACVDPTLCGSSASLRDHTASCSL